MEDRPLLDEQIAYYRARSSEYDEWFFRHGRYDRGPEHRAEWFRESSTIETVLRSTVPCGDILELACGTGLWTQHLAETGARVLAVDASPEAIAINRERVRSANVEYRVANIFSWTPATTFDCVFFSFWLSHVPAARFDEFWTSVRRMLRPNGQAFFIDSRQEQTSTARDHDALDDAGIVRRRLNDSREFQIVKVFYEPSVLEQRLAERGWHGWVRSTGKFFLYGAMTPIHGRC
jgi:2-polyprenyl-3-methyl-5-hydroxy-6-metoxy-1,4-benzoquinol methylase